MWGPNLQGDGEQKEVGGGTEVGWGGGEGGEKGREGPIRSTIFGALCG